MTGKLKTWLLSLSFAASAAAGTARADDTPCQPGPVVTTHTTVIGGGDLAYTATAGFLHVTAADGKSHACIFYTAYAKIGAAAAQRPLTFAFNGGPGAASLWLHLGIAGPKRLDLGPDGLSLFNPFRLVPNDQSLLDLSDVVLIDPVATGFSTPDPGADADQFFGVKNDYQSVAEFIRGYLSQADRWSSPKFVMGESYGGIRGALVSRYLQESLGINLNGIVFVSPWLSSATTNFDDPGNDLGYATFLPTYAMAGWYHKKLPAAMLAKTAESLRAEVEAFAMGPYLDALVQGNDLPDAQRQTVLAQLSSYTGLSPDALDELDLRVSDNDFFKHFFEKEGMAVGRFDARFKGGTVGHDKWYDVSSSVLGPQFTAGINDYFINDLGVHEAAPYVTAADLSKWPFNSDAQEFGVLNDLSAAMLDNPALKVFVAAGYYDLAVPYGATKYNFRHLSPHGDLLKRVTFSFFDAGHMVYTNPVGLVQLKTALRAFYAP